MFLPCDTCKNRLLCENRHQLYKITEKMAKLEDEYNNIACKNSRINFTRGNETEQNNLTKEKKE